MFALRRRQRLVSSEFALIDRMRQWATRSGEGCTILAMVIQWQGIGILDCHFGYLVGTDKQKKHERKV